MIASLDPASAPAGSASATPRPPSRRTRRDVSLGLAWLHGSLAAATFERQSVAGKWTSPTPARTVEEFGAALDGALAALDFHGHETFLVLEHERFAHRTESAPAFSEKAAQAYLQSRVARHMREQGPLIWGAQRTISTRRDASFVLHLLPEAFFEEINQALLARQLKLNRIFPLIVPLQLEIDALGAKDQPALVAAETGGTTTIVVGNPGGRLAFSRTLLADWHSESVRVGVEVNRSLLYAKQQWGALPDRIRLFGDEQAFAEVRNRCGEGKDLVSRPVRTAEWLQAVAALPRYDAVNVLSGHLRSRRRRERLRRLLAAGCWLGLGLFALNGWSARVAARAAGERFAALARREPALQAEHERLARRQENVARDREFIRQAADRRLPPVPARFAASLAGLLPREIRLAEFRVEAGAEAAPWSFRLNGTIDADEETARATLAALQDRIQHSPWRARFPEAPINLVPVASAGGGSVFGFTLGGSLFEN